MPPPLRSSSPRGEASLPPVQVTYHRRMKLQRVYPTLVGWRKGEAAAPGKKVTVRLLLAGAQVLPTEQTLDAGKPDDQATFYVTPLARGWLRGQRLEVLLDGRKVQELPLASKAVTHRLTWCLLLLTLLAPWFVNAYLKNSPFREKTAFDNNGVKVVKMNAERVGPSFEKALAESLPAMPELIDENVPQINDGLKTARSATADLYGELVNASQSEPYTFYATVILLGLTLLSALMHRDVRRKRVGKPIPLPQTSRVCEEEEEEATA